ncbi:DUF1592 domain-containing protein [Blastopirellula sp. J2-11]|uniref:DUF1592 domain-containing protein n=1 Tax=Blastopirellula sp. J2-11 TaxID=2943192 RepID=UPI0021CA206D|nr:DUF1592 domain-containing protein [Blastopirellula sp. J2-11]UUO04660.1 DUF1592 domain-containing protein [Blastopirellula sp. J2-11]
MTRKTAIAFLTALSLLTIGRSLAAAAPNFKQDIAPYLQANCIHCHGPKTQEGEFRIDTLSPNIGYESTPQWAEIMQRITSGEMPPEDAENLPSAQESAQIVEWLAARIEEGEAARMAQRGRVTYNRLTRDEYVNTVRDLIGVHFDATDPGGFPADPQWRGIQRIGSILTLAPSNIEKYLLAAETILSEAYPQKEAEFIDVTRRAVPDGRISKEHKERLSKLGQLDKVRYEMWAGDLYRDSNFKRLPAPGIYEMSIKLSGLKPEGGRAPRLYVYENSLDRVLFEHDIIAPEEEPITVTFRAHLPAGNPSVHIINEIPGLSTNFRSGRHGGRPFVSIKDGRLPWQMKLTDGAGKPLHPFLILDSISWRGPFITEQEQRRREEYWPAEEGNLHHVREGLRNLAQRAFRRPVSELEIDTYMRIVQAELDAGEQFSDAVKAGMLTILCSKSFLYIAEGDEAKVRHTLNDWEIASRLSYLFWSTMPDDELFQLAEARKLQDKAELRRQVKRMLADPKADRFCESFPQQWLQLDKVGMFPPDKQLYPDYDLSLEQSMAQETKHFFREVLHEGLTLHEFIHSDWTMVNSRLAQFYELPDSVGHDFERVTLQPDAHRGGLLSQAAILSLTSDGTRHRPVHRGKYILETFFGKSPPPPPANVDPIPTNPVDSPKSTLRQKLQAHVHDATCASCHRKIDPLGLAFENFDAIGHWRTQESVRGSGEDPAVDPSGQLADGRSFQTPAEFKHLMLQDIDKFNAAFIEKLATYGMRRAMTFEDREDLETIAAVSRASDYRLREILEAFVLSDLFQKR